MRFLRGIYVFSVQTIPLPEQFRAFHFSDVLEPGFNKLLCLFNVPSNRACVVVTFKLYRARLTLTVKKWPREQPWKQIEHSSMTIFYSKLYFDRSSGR